MGTDSTVRSSFTSFGDFPTEIRLKIWRYCIPTNRTIRAKLVVINRTPIISFERDEIPAALSTCRESRGEALRVYRPLFKSGVEPGRQFYVDITSDVLLIKRDFKATSRTTGVLYSLLNFEYYLAQNATTDLALCSTFSVPLGVVMSRTPTGEVYIVFRRAVSTGYQRDIGLALTKCPHLAMR